jgi:serine/threonine protein kinase
LIHHIKNSYAKDGVCPETTVDFYKVGKILGKGAFGKVNLSLHQLTQQMVAIKSINKTHFSESSQSKKVMQEVMILKQTRH